MLQTLYTNLPFSTPTTSMYVQHGQLTWQTSLWCIQHGPWSEKPKTDLAKYIPAVCSAKLMPVFLDMLNVKCGISKPCTMWDNSAEKFMWRNANTNANWVCMYVEQPTNRRMPSVNSAQLQSLTESDIHTNDPEEHLWSHTIGLLHAINDSQLAAQAAPVSPLVLQLITQ